jgi:hypothetical protein
MLTTNQKGFIAEQAVILECARRASPVSRPLDDQRYDLVLDLGSRLLRVQCKWQCEIARSSASAPAAVGAAARG